MNLPKRSGIPIEMTLAAIDEEGKVLREQYVNSFHRAFVWMLGQHLNNLSVSGMVDTGGTLRTAKGAHTSTSLGFRAQNGTAGNLTHGIICGLSNQAIDKTDYAMVNPIAEGTGVDQLNYGAMPALSPVDTVDGAVADLTRTVTNNSASAIDIEEVGFYFYNFDITAQVRYYMGDRTLFQKTIDPAEAVTFRYRIQTV